MDATKAKIKKDEKAAIDEARRVEREEKKMARDMEKQALQAKTDKERLAAEEKSETAFNAATEKAEAAILAAEQRSEDELSKALEQAEQAKEAAAERAELLEKAAADKFEAALSQAAETAERAEKDAVFEEEAVEQQVVATVDAIEKEDLIEENAGLEKAKEILASAWSIAAPLVIPGIFLALYAVLASFTAPPPEPCLGAEDEEVRKTMGRAERPKTARATMDPWEREGTKEMAKLGTGAMALLAVLMSSGPVSGFVSTSSPTLSSRTTRPTRTLAQGTPSQPRSSTTLGRATLAQGVAAVAVIAAAGRKRVAKHMGRWSQVVRCAKSSAITGKDPLHVIISGAGVGGLLLAKALSKEPTIKVTLLEQAPLITS